MIILISAPVQSSEGQTGEKQQNGMQQNDAEFQLRIRKSFYCCCCCCWFSVDSTNPIVSSGTFVTAVLLADVFRWWLFWSRIEFVSFVGLDWMKSFSLPFLGSAEVNSLDDTFDTDRIWLAVSSSFDASSWLIGWHDETGWLIWVCLSASCPSGLTPAPLVSWWLSAILVGIINCCWLLFVFDDDSGRVLQVAGRPPLGWLLTELVRIWARLSGGKAKFEKVCVIVGAVVVMPPDSPGKWWWIQDGDGGMLIV